MMPTFPGYDAWRLRGPPEPPECRCDAQDFDSPDCTCAEDAEEAYWDRADYLYQAQRDREME